MNDLQQQNNQASTEQVTFGAFQHNLSNIMPSASELGYLWSSYLALNVCQYVFLNTMF